MFLYNLLAFFLFFIINFVFIILISFFDEVSNVRNRILTNQIRELVVSNCQRNCINHMELRRHKITWPGYKGTFSNLNLVSFFGFRMTFFNLS